LAMIFMELAVIYIPFFLCSGWSLCCSGLESLWVSNSL
jgi:hypothetical protein